MYCTRILLIISLALLFTLDAQGQKKKTEEESNLLVPTEVPEGIVYALPRSVLIIEVKTQRNSFIPGPYAAYADKYLGIKQVKTSAEERWQLISMEVQSFTEPDPEAIFKSMNHAAPLALNSDGIITGILAGSGASGALQSGFHQLSSELPEVVYTDLSSDDFYEITVNSETGTELMSFKSTEQKAREAADYLIRLRKKRAFTILDPSDVVPEDGTGYGIFLKEAEKLEKTYTSLFTGKTVQSTQVHRFIYVPDKKEVKNDIIFRFSDEKGVLPKTDISGKPVMISIQSTPGIVKNIQNIPKKERTNTVSSGMYYRIPVVAELNISDGLNPLYTGRITLPQLGEVFPVPEHLLNGQFSISYHTTTGAIQEIKPLK